MDCHGPSDKGRSREINEDQFLIADLSKSMRIHQKWPLMPLMGRQLLKIEQVVTIDAFCA
jgi:hypothetical protein